MKEDQNPGLLTPIPVLSPWVQVKATLPCGSSHYTSLLTFPVPPSHPHILSACRLPPRHRKEHSFYRSTFTLCKIYWMLWFIVSYRKKKKSQYNSIIFNEVLLFFLLSLDIIFLGQSTSILTHVHAFAVYLIIVNTNWYRVPTKQCLPMSLYSENSLKCYLKL